MAATSSQSKETECAVCTNDFTTPKILPCGHLLCRECVVSWLSSKSEKGCPLCACPIVQCQGHLGPSSSDIADSLPTDFSMEALVGSRTALSKNRVCCACDDVRVEYFCVQCQGLLCQSCCEMHKKIPGTRSHDVENLSFVIHERLVATRHALCADHGDIKSCFCSDHGVSVCTSCAITKHRSCAEVKDINNDVKSAEESMKYMVNILLKAERELEQSIAEVDKRLQEVNGREQQDMAEVDKVCKRLRKLVDDFRNKMKEISRNSHSEVKKFLQDIKTSLGQRLGIVTSHKRIMSRTLAIAPRPKLIHATKALQDRVNGLHLTADLTLQVWGNPPLYGTRCHDVIRRIQEQLEMAEKRTTDLKDTYPQYKISAEAQTFWQQWVEAAFPDLDSRAYFLPPVHVNHVTTRQSSYGQPPPVHDSDVRDDAALKRVFCCLQKMSEQNGQVFVGMSQLQFGQYQGQPCYSAAFACLLESANLVPALSRNFSAGDFDVLLIHRQYGLVAIEVKCIGGRLEKLHKSQQDLDDDIRKNMKDAVSQLAKTKTVLSHLVSDVAPGLRITNTITFPYLTACQVQQAISVDSELTQDLCRCLGTTDPADITGLCVCSDQLSDPQTPWDVSSDVLRELGNWWQRRVAVSGPDSHIIFDIYRTLVARLCGPATTVTVPCIFPPRLCVKTLGQAVSLTGECYTAQINLFPEQLDLLNTAHPRVFVAGPPGTGKSVVLLLKATEWLRCGHDVHIVSPCDESRAACSMLYHLLLQIVNTQLTSVASPGQPHLLQYDFYQDLDRFLDVGEDLEEDMEEDMEEEVEEEVEKDVDEVVCLEVQEVVWSDVEDGWSHVRENGWSHVRVDEVPYIEDDVAKAVNILSRAASRGSLYVIADEVPRSPDFRSFCVKLLRKVPHLHLWMAGCYHGYAPTDWHVEYLTRPLRSPPAVVREVQQDETITKSRDVVAYSERGVADHTDGPPVRRLYHRPQDHLSPWPQDCVTCGREVASFLHSLCVGVPGNVAKKSATVFTTTSGGTTTPCLQWRDVLVLYDLDISEKSGMVTGLREAGIPVRVMTDDDIEDVATARSDVVWAAHRNLVGGLERKVVVCLESGYSARLRLMSRCTSQLLIVSFNH